MPTLITDPAEIRACAELIWRQAQRDWLRVCFTPDSKPPQRLFTDCEVERLVFLKWRTREAGGVEVVIQGLGRIRKVV